MDKRTQRRLLAAAVASAVCYVVAARKKTSGDIPTKMKRLVLVEPNKNTDLVKIALVEVDVPKPKSGQVLVKMAAAPVNPSDVSSWLIQGVMAADGGGVQQTKDVGGGVLAEPRLMGSEGCGVVVASGGGVLAGKLVGKNVGAVPGEGSYSQYVCVDAMGKAWELDQSVPVEDCASFFVNPLTAMAIIDTVKKHGEKIFIHTAAASQLGQMIARVAPSMDVTVVCCVRRQEQADTLAALGVKHIVIQEDGWQTELKALIESLKIKVAFDCIAGDMTGTLVGLLPEGSTVHVYGGLSSRVMSSIGVRDLIYAKKKVQGFYVTDWIMAGGGLKTVIRLKSAYKIINPGLRSGNWASSQFVDCTMEEMWPKYLAMLASPGQRDKKLRIRF